MRRFYADLRFKLLLIIIAMMPASAGLARGQDKALWEGTLRLFGADSYWHNSVGWDRLNAASAGAPLCNSVCVPKRRAQTWTTSRSGNVLWPIVEFIDCVAAYVRHYRKHLEFD
jgi:hypothetical protein